MGLEEETLGEKDESAQAEGKADEPKPPPGCQHRDCSDRNGDLEESHASGVNDVPLEVRRRR